jgi:prephenate dehydrogenase
MHAPQGEPGATRVAIIGLGAIGGSAALKLIERGAVPTGFAIDDVDRALAAKAGMRVADDIASAVAGADLVLLAVPLDALANVAREVLAHVGGHATVLHAAGLQRPDATQLDPQAASRIVGTHPLAGTAHAGFGAATATMFSGATVFIEPRGTARMREDAELFWSMAGASRIEYLSAEDHDNFVAAVSHVPQIVATALGATLSYANVRRTRLGPGGRDMTRLAASPWSMWRPLLAATPGRTLAMLESIESELRDIREAIAKQSLDETAITWEAARGWSLEANEERGIR